MWGNGGLCQFRTYRTVDAWADIAFSACIEFGEVSSTGIIRKIGRYGIGMIIALFFIDRKLYFLGTAEVLMDFDNLRSHTKSPPFYRRLIANA